MTSDRKFVANRENAKKSTGPRSVIGQRSSSRNALRHGLAVSVGSEPSFGPGIETMAKAIASASGQDAGGILARQLAEAEIDLSRIRRIHTSLFKTLYAKQPDVQLQDYAELAVNLAKLQRYERRAFSRRKRALQDLSEAVVDVQTR